MLRRKAVEQHDGEMLKHDWKDEIQLSEEYVGYQKQIFNILIEPH